MGSTGGDHHVVDRRWEILEERLQGSRIVGIEGRGALRAEFERCSLEPFGIAPGEDDARALRAGSPGGFQPNAGAAADDDHGLAEQFRFALGGYSSGCGFHDSSGGFMSSNLVRRAIHISSTCDPPTFPGEHGQRPYCIDAVCSI